MYLSNPREQFSETGIFTSRYSPAFSFFPFICNIFYLIGSRIYNPSDSALAVLAKKGEEKKKKGVGEGIRTAAKTDGTIFC